MTHLIIKNHRKEVNKNSLLEKDQKQLIINSFIGLTNLKLQESFLIKKLISEEEGMLILQDQKL